VKGSDVDYNGSPTGYTADPQEVVTYVEAHDNQTLWDITQYKLPATTSMADRVRVHNLGNDIVMLGQGVPFFHAGQDMLRSKSLDRNSYNSGDWFNKLDFTYQSNNWGVGLPIPEGESDAERQIQAQLLSNPALKPSKDNILSAVNHFREMLRIRKSSKLFRLESADDINQRLRYYNPGPDAKAGLLVMTISDMVGVDLDSKYEQIVVVVNANDEAQSFAANDFKGKKMQLHPVLVESVDPVVKTSTFNTATGTFNVPARTTAVFVMK
jgi:pullulanase/glycogen debranching enzyme